MNLLDDKLSKLAALRPRSGVVHIAGNRVNSEELQHLLEGEICRNRFGNCLRTERRFQLPAMPAVESKVMQLMIPNATANICDTKKWLFLDTETTGLSGGTGTYAFLVGLAWWEGAAFVVEQYLMRDYSEERALLCALSERLAERRVLVTFNGKSFDWPLLTTRFQMSRMVGSVPELDGHLDLLHPARRLWRLNLRSVALKELERHILKFDRGPDIPSASIPQRYFDFVRGGPASAIAEIVQHNQMDLYGLAFLAVHINEILTDPESCCSGSELFGISRLLQDRGECLRAEQIYRRSLDEGLPASAELMAHRELAIMAKRNRDYETSRIYWEKLLGDTIEGLKAYEQLAIHYEHYDPQPQKAAMLAREALVKMQEACRAGRLPAHRYRKLHANFQHRLARLNAIIQDS
jgi:uncharacterized protein